MFKVGLFEIKYVFIFNNSICIIESRDNWSQSWKYKVVSLENIVKLHIQDEHIKSLI